MTTSEDAEEFRKYLHIILADGGDGTFDYLYVKYFKQLDMWSKKDGCAFNCAGTFLYQQFKALIKKVFLLDGEDTLDFFKNKCLNEWYDSFKK